LAPTISPFDLPPKSPLSRIFLIRHGATEHNIKRPFVLQGCEIDGPLNDTGRRQAAAVTSALAGISLSAIYASPMQRALETVGQIAATRSLDIQVVEGLRECHVGRWAGLSWEQIREREPERVAKFLANPAVEKHPDGESYLDLQARVIPAFNDIVGRHAGQNILIMAHNMVNRVLLATLLEMDLSHARKIKQNNCCINVLQHSEETTDVITINSIWHLETE
jgi:broad specificity phosphatase PhoE